VGFLLEDRPKVFVAAHFGNFELNGYVLGMWGFPTFTVARPLDNPYLDRFVNRFRGSTGQFMLPKQGSSLAVDQLLSRGGMLAVLGDQAAGAKGCWVDFFGRPASTHKAIAVFALANHAPLSVGFARRRDATLQYEIGIEATVDTVAQPELADVTTLTTWFTRHVEALIRRHPDQYWWVHRRWKGEPPARRGKRAA
jgi:KDO2-lipid IV(A) lauroyltransferase